ncbi:P-loop containing nucleoside triphosphate hydrolase protein [Aspergillus karnatakaensis]|uniref:ABC transporter ATP-binding protein n=1 Tax=Aspergillus karnatakaensis TaxID=1810916 RepID=UPI003CCD47C3
MAVPLKDRLLNLFKTPLFDFTTRKHVPTLVIASVCCFIASFTTPLFSVVLGEVFDQYTLFGGGEITGSVFIHGVTKACIHFVALGALGWFWNAVYFILFVIFGELQAACARGRLFEGLLRKDQRFFEEQEEGARTFLGSLQVRIQELQTGTSNSLGLVLQYTFRTLVSLGVAFYTSWNLSLVILAGLPIVSLIVPILAPKINAAIENQQKELKTASKVVNISVLAIDTVKCLNAQSVEEDKFSSGVDKAASHHGRQAHFNALQIAAVGFMMFAMFVQGFWYGSTLVTSGKLSGGDVIRTFWACSTAAQSLESMMPHLVFLEKGKVAATALRNALHGGAKEASKEIQGALYPRHCEGDIKVSNLSFAYPSQPDKLSLQSTSFCFPAHTTTFVIGKSGSGKSTLGQLLTRFYLPTSGELFIDGNPIQTLSVSWIRNNITYVEQRSILFNETIFNNIAFGKLGHGNVQKHEVEGSIDLAMLTTTIANLPHGIDTLVGEGGNALSGGQRQRVAIARARLRDTPVLILDEPTSALDGANRMQVMNAIRKWRKGKTSIIITHDMSHIRDDDFAYVLDQGSLVQAGYKRDLKLNPFLSEFFRQPEPIDSKDEFSKSGFYSDSSDASSSTPGNGRLPPAIPRRTYSNHSSLQHWGSRRSSIFSRGQMLSRDGSFRKDALVRYTEVELDSLPIKAEKLQSQNSSSKRSKVRQLKSRQQRIKLRHVRSTDTMPPSIDNPIRTALKSVVPSLSHKQRFFLLIAVLCALAHASATPLFSYFLSCLLQTFYNGKNEAMRWALAVLGIAICDAFITYFMYHLFDTCGQSWVDRLRKKAFHQVLDQERSWFEDNRNSAAQISRCLHESGEDVRNILARFSAFVLISLLVTVMAVIWSMAICWKQTLVALSCGPIIYAVTSGFETTSGIWDKRCTAARMTASEVFLETFSEIRTVRSLTLEHHFHLKHFKAASQCLTLGLRKAIYTGPLFGLVESMIVFISAALLFYYGATLVRYNEFTVDHIMSVNSVLLFSIAYASTVMTWIPQISNSREMAQRLLRLVELPVQASHEHKGTIQTPKAAPIRIERLTFHYPSRPDAVVLQNVSFNIPEGSCTAIVGRSGSGKSTIASLLLSLYESPLSYSETPTFSLNGIDIRKLHTPSLRSMISIVSQQPTIFPGTIQENISYALDPCSPLSTLFNVRAAARAAGIDEFISSLPKGYETVVGDGGIGLSGGQAQRVIIARALLRNPQILVLDEATSALDPESAELIRQTVRGLVDMRRGLTVIIITHSKEMMEIADNVIVLEDGRVVEEGAYRTLSKRVGGKLRGLVEHPDAHGSAM